MEEDVAVIGVCNCLNASAGVVSLYPRIVLILMREAKQTVNYTHTPGTSGSFVLPFLAIGCKTKKGGAWYSSRPCSSSPTLLLLSQLPTVPLGPSLS